MWPFVCKSRLSTFGCVPMRLRWRLPDRLKPWRKLWIPIKRWKTYLEQKLVFPDPGSMNAEPIHQPPDHRLGHVIHQERFPVKMPSRDLVLEGGLSGEDYQRLLGFYMKSRHGAVRNIERICDAMAGCLAAELLASIQGSVDRHEIESDNQHGALNSAETPREVIRICIPIR